MSHVLKAVSMESQQNLTIVLKDGVKMSLAWGERAGSNRHTVEVAFFKNNYLVEPDDFDWLATANVYTYIPVTEALAYAAANVEK